MAVDLLSPEGEPYVGHQWEFFDVSDTGVVSAKQPAWVSLYQTEGREFTLTGEVRLGGPDKTMLHPEDLPDGFALFVREWSGVERYQADSRALTVKRRLLNGEPTTNIESYAFPAPSQGGWIPFKIHVSQDGIEYTFGNHNSRLEGPLDMNGANKIVIAPGTKMRNLQLTVEP